MPAQFNTKITRIQSQIAIFTNRFGKVVLPILLGLWTIWGGAVLAQKPVIVASGPTTFCAGGRVKLTATGYSNYRWNNGSIIDSIIVTVSGTYTVTAIGNGATSLPVIVTVRTPPATPTITPSGPISLCEYDSVELVTPRVTGYQYLWSTLNYAISSNKLKVRTSGSYNTSSYTVKVIDTTSGCTSAASAPIVVSLIRPIATIKASGPTSICPSGSVTLTASGGDTYLWNDGTTNPELIANTSGTYSVQAIKNGCKSPISAPVMVTVSKDTAFIATSEKTNFGCGAGTVHLYGPDPSNPIVNTYAGSGYNAPFSNMEGLATDKAGNIYVAEPYANRISKIDPLGNITTFAGNGARGSNDGTYLASFNYPRSVAVDTFGNVYVADYYNNKIRKISPSGYVSTFAGSGNVGSVNGIGAVASFYNPSGVAVGDSGNVYVVDAGNRLIRKITPSGLVSTFAGSGNYGSSDGPGTTASFLGPQNLTLDSKGNIYVSDSNKIRKISPTGLVSTLAGNNNYGWYDGIGKFAKFYSPKGLVVDANGNVFVADEFNHTIRKIDPSGQVSTLAGNSHGYYGYYRDGPGNAAYFSYPTGIAMDALGNIYVADAGNYRIRKISFGNPITAYSWNTGATTQNITVKKSGIYKLRTVSCNNDTSAPYSVVVTMDDNAPNPEISVKGPGITDTLVNGPITFCDSVILTAKWKLVPGYDTSRQRQYWTTEYGQYFKHGFKIINGYVFDTTIVRDSYVMKYRIWNNSYNCEYYSDSIPLYTFKDIVQESISTTKDLDNWLMCVGDSLQLTSTAKYGNLWNTGDTTQSIYVKKAGVYFCTFKTNSLTGCRVTSNTLTVADNPDSVAIIEASGPINFCKGDNVILSASQVNGINTNWQWTGTKPASTQSMVVYESGTYTLTYTNANGCKTKTASVTVTVSPTPKPVASITASGPITFAKGGTVTLTASNLTPNLGDTYKWSSGQTTKTIDVTTTGTYNVQVINTEGCTSEISNSIIVTVFEGCKPYITEVNPTNVNVGDQIIITGANLATTTSVTLGTLSAPFVVIGNDSLLLQVPVGAVDGSSITVINTCTGTNNNTATSVATISIISNKFNCPNTVNNGVLNFTDQFGSVSVNTGNTCFWSFTAEADRDYYFSTCGSSSTTKLTLYNSAGTSNISNNSNGPLCSESDKASLIFKAPSSGTWYVQLTDPSEICNIPLNAVLLYKSPVPPPTNNFIDPNEGPVGKNVTFKGSHLTGTTQVSFNGLPCVFSVLDANTVLLTIPYGASGNDKITLTTPGGTVKSTMPFKVTTPPAPQAPTITGFSPTSGPVGTAVTLTGSNFSGAFLATLGGVGVNNLFVVDVSTVTFTVPVGATSGNIKLFTPDGSGQSATSFTVTPNISGFYPASGPIGTAVTLTGTNFTGATDLKIGSIDVPGFTVLNDNTILLTIPAGAPTTGAFTVSTSDGAASSANTYNVSTTPTVPQAPTITNFTSTGRVGTQVTLTGTNLSSVFYVSLNGTGVSNLIINATGTQLTFNVPAGATSGPITLVNSVGSPIVSAGIFTLIPAPIISSISPDSGHAGKTVTITGNNFTGFTGALEVKIGAIVIQNPTITATSITLTIPALATTNAITVSTPGGTATSTVFTVNTPTSGGGTVKYLPKITNFSPDSATPADSITISGNNLNSVFLVTIGNQIATGFSYNNSSTTLKVAVPQGAETGKVKVVNPDGQDTYTIRDLIIKSSPGITGLPHITRFDPTSGPVGSIVVLSGQNLDKVNSVFIGNVQVTNIIGQTYGSIVFSVPTGATTDSIKIKFGLVTANGGQIFIVNFAKPVLSYFTPKSGLAGDGILISGQNFGSNISSIKFNGIASTTFTIFNGTTLSAQVPTGATTGKITIIYGSDSVKSADDFIVHQKPKITSLSKNAGLAGDTITITGSNFNNLLFVYFNGTSASFWRKDSTKITALVPFHAFSGKVSVVSSYGLAESDSSFTVGSLPAAPTLLQSDSGGQKAIRIKWQDNSSNETGFGIEYSTNANFVPSTVDTAGKNTSKSILTGLTTGTVYFIRVYALGQFGNSDTTVAIKVTTWPLAPDNVNLTVSALTDSSINLLWSDPSGRANTFKVFRGTGANNFSDSVIVNLPNTSYLSTGLMANTQYFYQVIAYFQPSNAPRTPILATRPYATGSAVTLPDPLDPPTDLRVTSISPDTNRLTFTDKAAGESKFEVLRANAGNNWLVVGTLSASRGQGKVLSFKDSSVYPNRFYKNKIRTIHPGDPSRESNKDSVTTLPLSPVKPVIDSVLSKLAGQATIKWQPYNNDSVNCGRVDLWLQYKYATQGWKDMVILKQSNTSKDTIGLAQLQLYKFRLMAKGPRESVYSDSIARVIRGSTDPPLTPTIDSVRINRANNRVEVLINTKQPVASVNDIHLLSAVENSQTHILSSYAPQLVIASSNNNSTYTLTVDLTEYCNKYYFKVFVSNGPLNSDPSVVKTFVNPCKTPTYLEVFAVNNGKLLFNWNDENKFENGFRLSRAKKNSRTLYDSVAIRGLNYTNDTVSMGYNTDSVSEYYVQAYSVFDGKHYYSDTTNHVIGKPAYAPVPPKDLSTTAYTNYIDLGWNYLPTNADSFVIEIIKGPLPSTQKPRFDTVRDGSKRRYPVDGLDQSQDYCFRIRVFARGPNGAECSSPYSAWITSRLNTGGVTINAPSRPQNLQAYATSPTSILLKWDNLTGHRSGFNVVRIGRDVNTIPVASASSFTDNNLLPNHTYSYAIFSVDNSIQSLSSDTVTVTTGCLKFALDSKGAHVFCRGKSRVLGINPKLPAEANAQYRWYKDGKLIPGAQKSTLVVDSTGNYRASVSAYGCSLLGTDSISFTAISFPDSLWRNSQGQLQANQLDGATYQWFRDNQFLKFTTTEFYTPDAVNGLYYVIISKGACSFTTNYIKVDNINSGQRDNIGIGNAPIAIYPQPAQDFVTINGLAKGSNLIISDLMGRQLLSVETDEEVYNLKTEHLQTGTYILQIHSGNLVLNQKMVVAK